MIKKIFSYVVLPIVIIGLVWLVVNSIMKPVRFNNEKAAREQVGIQRLKDIRDLQRSFKSENGRFTESIDSLIDFYKNGELTIVMQIGSNDDSLAVANTQQVKRRNPRITNEELYERYLEGESLVFSIASKIPVRDTLFTTRDNFTVDSLAYIPFSGGQPILMEAVIKRVSGVDVPLFEASMPYRSLLKGMDNQLRINLDSEREDTGRYAGLKVGSVTAPNNDAGNWE